MMGLRNWDGRIVPPSHVRPSGSGNVIFNQANCRVPYCFHRAVSRRPIPAPASAGLPPSFPQRQLPRPRFKFLRRKIRGGRIAADNRSFHRILPFHLPPDPFARFRGARGRADRLFRLSQLNFGHSSVGEHDVSCHSVIFFMAVHAQHIIPVEKLRDRRLQFLSGNPDFRR